jgi:hypothetical protein
LNPWDEDPLYLGIDPGKTGAGVLVDQRGLMVDSFRFAKHTLEETDAWLAELRGGGHVAALEKVASSPQMGVRSAFSFGRSLGQIEALLVSSGIRIVRVAPRTWQKTFGIQPRRKKPNPETQTQFKKRVRALAEERFPGHIKTADLADAALLAEWCRRDARG